MGPDGRRAQLFTPGIAGQPPLLAGREKELGDLKMAVYNMLGTGAGGRPILLFGPRGVGKTALLEKFEIDSPYGADIRCTTPSTGLADTNNIPRVLLSDQALWKKWIPSKGGIDIASVLGLNFEWNLEEADSAELIKNRIISKCAEQPMVLIVDEAHMLRGQAGEFFLNYMQGILKKSARLLVVLAGTPNLRSALSRIGASFIGRGEDMRVGSLFCEDARESVEIPIRDERVSIDESVLDEVVKDSQGYPLFLQIWGQKLWASRPKPAMDSIGWNECQVVRDVVEREKNAHYQGYFQEISDLTHLIPAAAIAEAFKRRDEMSVEEAFSIVFSTVDASLNTVERDKMAHLIMERLKAKDVIWESGDGVAKPALPSFHAYILKHAKKRLAALRRVGAEIDIWPGASEMSPDVDAPAVPPSG